MTQLEQFITENRTEMLACLTTLVKALQCDIKEHPDWYLEHGCDEPMINIRLCIDSSRHRYMDVRAGYGDDNIGFEWIFRTGLVDYDTSHSEYCAASCVGLETYPSELLDELINQLDNE